MRNDLRNRGIGLAELLASLVIFGIALSLGGMLVASLIRASDRILVSQRATTLGNLIVSQLEDSMVDAAADQYSSCPGNQDCIIMTNTFDYEWNEILGEVVLTIHNPVLQTRVEIDNGQILIEGLAMDLGEFTLDPLSAMALSLSGADVTVSLSFSLISSDGQAFAFTASHRFTLADIPLP
jgi:hypothetical protein